MRKRRVGVGGDPDDAQIEKPKDDAFKRPADDKEKATKKG
jgi:hypothetical protein